MKMKCVPFWIGTNIRQKASTWIEVENCIHNNPYRISKEYMIAIESPRITARVTGILDAENVWYDRLLPAFPIAPPTFEMARSEVFTAHNTSTSTVTDIEGTRKRRSLVQ
jgi:hypothetical protein